MKDSALYPAWCDLDPIRIYHEARLGDVYGFSLMHAADPRLMSLVRYRSRLLHVPVLDREHIRYLMASVGLHCSEGPGSGLFTAEQAQCLRELGDGQNIKLLPARIGDGDPTYTIGGLPPRSWRALYKLLSEVLTQDEHEQLKSTVHSRMINMKVGSDTIEMRKSNRPSSLFNAPLRRSFASNVLMEFPLDVAEESGRYLLRVVLPGVFPEDIAITLEVRTPLRHYRRK